MIAWIVAGIVLLGSGVAGAARPLLHPWMRLIAAVIGLVAVGPAHRPGGAGAR